MKNKIILSLLLFANLIKAEEFEIPTDNVKVIKDSEIKKTKKISEEDTLKVLKTSVEKDKKVIKLEEVDSPFGESRKTISIDELQDDINKVKKIKLKIYKDVKYVKGYDWFSLRKPNKETYLWYLHKVNMSELLAEKLIGYANNPKSIFVSALYYDLVEHKPEIAENFYLKFDEQVFKRFGFFAKEALADYLIRTGRYQNNEDFLRKGDCFSYKVEYQKECFYYYGIATFLTTGINKNTGLRVTKDTYKQAKIIYNKK